MWHLIVLMSPRSCITAFSVRPFVCLSLFHCVLCRDFSPATFSDSAPECDGGWLRVAPNVISRYASVSMNFTTFFSNPWILDGFLLDHTAHDVLVPLFFRCDARHGRV